MRYLFRPIYEWYVYWKYPSYEAGIKILLYDSKEYFQ